MEQLKPVGEQVVVLMGASSSIGRESALRFALKGAKVVTLQGRQPCASQGTHLGLNHRCQPKGRETL